MIEKENGTPMAALVASTGNGTLGGTPVACGTLLRAPCATSPAVLLCLQYMCLYAYSVGVHVIAYSDVDTCVGVWTIRKSKE